MPGDVFAKPYLLQDRMVLKICIVPNIFVFAVSDMKGHAFPDKSVYFTISNTQYPL